MEKKTVSHKIYIIGGVALLLVLAAIVMAAEMLVGPGIPLPGRKSPAENAELVKEANDPLITKVAQDEDFIREPLITDKDPVYGDASASSTIVIFSDFTCSYCLKSENSLISLAKSADPPLKVVRKDYPESDDKTTDSYKAALIGRCMQKLGKFWPFHDKLAENGEAVGIADVLEIAGLFGMDNGSVEKCLDDKDALDLVMQNIREANALAISGVPSMFINGKEFIGEMTENDIKDALTLGKASSNP